MLVAHLDTPCTCTFAWIIVLSYLQHICVHCEASTVSKDMPAIAEASKVLVCMYEIFLASTTKYYYYSDNYCLTRAIHIIYLITWVSGQYG